MNMLIKNGTVINPATGLNDVQDVYLEDGIIKEIGLNIDKTADQVIDANNYWVVPGLIDVHVHLREPGFEYKETIESGTRSAARGGFTTVCAMPNTKPTIDNKMLVEYIKLKAKNEGAVHVLPIGAITIGQNGQELVDMRKMKEAGICGISEDGRSVMNAGLLKKAMIEAKMLDLPVLSHCEDDSLAGNGCMNAGKTATILGLPGIPEEAEDVIVSRDIILAKETDVKLHICHVSTKGSVDLIKKGKDKGVKVTAEVCPHHFTLTEEAVDGKDANTKMNPPLRTAEDVKAMKDGLKDGTIDMIATDHAPHHTNEKNLAYQEAANGIVGLETAVPLTITELVNQGYLTSTQFVEKLSYNPAKMLGIDKGNIDVGKIADITIIDPTKEYVIDINDFESKSKNSPFHGRKVTGKVKYTIVNGIIKYED